MKILSGPEGDGLLTNAEVLHWLREKNFEIKRDKVAEGVPKTPSSTARVANQVRQYIENSPAAAQTTQSVKKLFVDLAPFHLSSPELLMLANIRPTAYAHITALIANVHDRFTDDQITEILTIINNTLEKRSDAAPHTTDPSTAQVPNETEDVEMQSIQDAPYEEGQDARETQQVIAPTANPISASANHQLDAHSFSPINQPNAQNTPPDAVITDISHLASSAIDAQAAAKEQQPTGMDATITDLTSVRTTPYPAPATSKEVDPANENDDK